MHSELAPEGVPRSLGNAHRLQRIRARKRRVFRRRALPANLQLRPDSPFNRALEAFCQRRPFPRSPIQWIDEQNDSHAVDSDASPLAECESDLLGSVRVLFRAALVLLQLSGVVKKYRATLCSGLARLFALDPACVPRFFREITCKWPVCTSRKVRLGGGLDGREWRCWSCCRICWRKRRAQ